MPGTDDGEENQYHEDNFELDSEALFDLEEPTRYSFKTHAPFFEKHNIDPLDILIKTNYVNSNFEEVYVGKYYSTINQNYYQVYHTKAEKWCFYKFINENSERYFFTECSLILYGDAHLREVNANCPYPHVSEPPAPIQEICYM